MLTPMMLTERCCSMHTTTIPFAIQLPCDVPFAFSLTELAAHLALLPDLRKRRGVRYPLSMLLTIAVLAKLAGQSRLEPIADWAQKRAVELAQLFGRERTTMPHQTTWSRVFGLAVDVDALEQSLARFFQNTQRKAELRSRGSIVLAIDGKTVRGTIPAGSTQGLHLMAAYLPQQGVVLAQLAVDTKTNEIVAAPKVLAQLDLSGIVVTGDAMQAQRELSIQVVQQGGDFLWFVKENQPSLLADIQQALLPLAVAKGWSAPPQDWPVTIREMEKGHGRLEERIVTSSSILADYHDWPYLQQVFRITRRVWDDKKQEWDEEERYGITSLPSSVADTRRLGEIARQEWGIENGLHYRRDVTLHEDAGQLRRGDGPQVLAALNNAVVGIVLQAGHSNLAAAQRAFDFPFDRFLARLPSA
jgi:predicted transposase YbfD/YdcC